MVEHSGRRQNIAAGVTESKRSGLLQGGEVHAIDARIAAVAGRAGYSNHVRALQRVRAGVCIVAARDHVERHSGLQRHDAVCLPATENRAQ